MLQVFKKKDAIARTVGLLYAISCNFSKVDRANLDNILVLSVIPSELLKAYTLAPFLTPLIKELHLLVHIFYFVA